MAAVADRPDADGPGEEEMRRDARSLSRTEGDDGSSENSIARAGHDHFQPDSSAVANSSLPNVPQQQQQERPPSPPSPLVVTLHLPPVVIFGSLDDSESERDLIRMPQFDGRAAVVPATPPAATATASVESIPARAPLTPPRCPPRDGEQLPLSTPKIWLGVPEDLVHLMASFMDAGSLCRFGAVDQLNAAVCNSHRLWYTLALQPCSYANEHFDQRDSDRELDPKRWFALRYSAQVVAHRARLQDHVVQVHDAYQLRRGAALYVFTDWMFPLCTFAMILLCLSLVVWELHTRGRVTMRSLWPLLVMVTYFACLTPILCGQHYRHPEFRLGPSPSLRRRVAFWFWDLVPIRWFTNSYSPFQMMVGVISEMTRHEPLYGQAHASFTLFFFALLAFVFVFLLRIGGALDCDWGAIFSPFYFACCVLATAPHFRWCNSNTDFYTNRTRYGAWIAFWILAGIPSLAFFVLLHIKLQYAPSTLLAVYVMMPLFYMDVAALLFALYRIYDGGESPLDIGKIIGWGGSWLVVWGPPLIFKILLALKLDNGVSFSYAQVFGPLYVSMAVILLLGGGMSSEIIEESNSSSEHGWAELPPPPKPQPPIDDMLPPIPLPIVPPPEHPYLHLD